MAETKQHTTEEKVEQAIQALVLRLTESGGRSTQILTRQIQALRNALEILRKKKQFGKEQRSLWE